MAVGGITELGRRLFGQGSLLFLAIASAQLFSFLRNAILGHWLSNGDFGIAATITLTLQLLESLSDTGADRLVVQADDGGSRPIMSAAHTVFIMRGLITSLVLFVFAGQIAEFFTIPEAAWALRAVALVPLIKAFIHLDMRRRQRRLDNIPFAIIEVVPQLTALIVTVPILDWHNNFSAVVYIAVIQAATALALSHALAKTTYETSLDLAALKRLAAFGWPLWLSAIPLIVVLQGDKIIVARFFGMEALAGFNAAFMICMMPALLASKLAYALLLPVLAAEKSRAPAFTLLYRNLSLVAVAAAIGYMALFATLGGWLVKLAFGPNYAGLSGLTIGLAMMWALRMTHLVPTISLLATGHTRSILYAGLVRVSALVLALLAAMNGLGIEGVIGAGIIGELMTLIFVLGAAHRLCPISWRQWHEPTTTAGRIAP